MTEEITKEQLKKYDHYLTVGKLLEFIKKHNIPNDALVLSQRVEDIYFEKYSWGVYLKEGYGSHRMKEFNRSIDTGEFDDKEKYPSLTDEMKNKFTEEDIISSMEQYHPVWSPVYYEDDSDILFLDLHY